VVFSRPMKPAPLAVPALFVAGLLALGCGTASEPGPSPDAGTPVNSRVKVAVSGTVRVHPVELAWRKQLGEAAPPLPSLEGTTLAIEDAVKALIGATPLVTTKLAADGAFSFEAVDVTNVSLAIVASLTDAGAGEDRFFASGYGLYSGRPTADLAGRDVYVLSRAFVKALQGAMPSGAAPLVGGEFVFGMAAGATDAEGVPGATFAYTYGKAQDERVYYLSDDLSKADGAATGATGAFVYFPKAGATEEFTMTKTGATFEKLTVGARKGLVLSSIFNTVAP
jgi:hypothetical protein